MTKIVAISDTHNLHDELVMPPGDILVHAGDFSNRGTLDELEKFAIWWHKQDYKLKLFVPGNHDFCFDPRFGWERSIKAKVMIAPQGAESYCLIDSGFVHEDLFFYGSPWVLTIGMWAFERTEEELEELYKNIPANDGGKMVLITHSPPAGILDKAHPRHIGFGSESLRARLIETVPTVHIFGHVHEGYGSVTYSPIEFYNVAQWDYTKGKHMNGPVVIEV